MIHFLKPNSSAFELDYDFVRTIPAFREILEKDTGNLPPTHPSHKPLQTEEGALPPVAYGYHAALDKPFAASTLLYVFFCCEFTERNPLHAVPVNERHDEACVYAGLTESISLKLAVYPNNKKPTEFLRQWKDRVERAKEAYLEVAGKMNPAIATCINLQKSLAMAGTAVERINKKIEMSLQRIEASEDGVTEQDLNSVVTNIQTILTLSKNIKSSIADVNALLVEIKKDRKEVASARGGKVIGNRADPKDRRP